MKVKNYLFIMLSLLFNVAAAYAQCNSVDAGDDRVIICGDSIRLVGHPKWSDGLDSTASNFHGVFFTDSITGYTVGDNGIIHKTLNGGVSWISQTSGVTNNLQAVFFTNANTGYVVGENGLILKTINGGTKWTSLTSGTTNTLYSVFFTDANTGIAVGTNGAILKTINAGASWTVKPSYILTNLISVYFASTSVGYIASDGKILKTIDGGEIWKVIQNAPGNIFIKIFFTNVSTGYVTLRDANGANTILKTTNGGTNWFTLNISSTYTISSMFFTGANMGYAGSGGRIFKTNDAGVTWESQPVNIMNIEDIYFPTPKTGYAVGYGTTVKKTVKYVIPDNILWTPATGLNSTTIMNPIASPNVTTTYTLTTKKGTCIQSDTIRVLVTPLKVNAGNDQRVICGGSAQLTNVTSNYFGKLTFSWLPTTGLSDATIPNPIVTIKQTTTYTLTVKTPNGCTAKDSVKIFVDPLKANAGSDRTLTCGGGVQLAHVASNYTGTGSLTYSWSPATGLSSSTIPNPISTTIKETNYYVTITTPNGCKATDSVKVFVDHLKANAGSDKALICGGSIQLDAVASNYTGAGKLNYSWVPTTGLNNPNSINPLVTITNPETFHVMITTENGCTATDSVKVIIQPLVVNAGIDKLHACGDSIKFIDVHSNYTGGTPLSYSWLPVTALNNAMIANPVSTAGEASYTLTISTQSGCKASDDVKINLKKRDPIEICIVGLDDKTGNNKIVWNHPDFKAIDSVFIYKETNVLNNFVKIGSVAYASGEFIDNTSQSDVKSERYKISILDSCGLESIQSKSHKTMYLSINKGIGSSWNLIWEPYEGFATNSYFIYRGKDISNLILYGSVSGNTQFTDFSPPAGTLYYQVETTNPNPCNTPNGITVRSNISSGNAVGINEFSNELAFSIYPNPANNSLTLKFENTLHKDLVFTIYNAIGAIVKTVTIHEHLQQIDVNDLSSGFYTVELKSKNERSVQKLAIEK